MSYNGSGTFQINSAGQPVVSGTVISSTAFNALTADLATGLSTCITKDGQTTVTANIPMGNNKITGLAVGTAATDAANLSQVQSTAAKLINSVSGADTITGTMSPTLASYAAGQMFYWVAAGDNTGAVTLNIDSLGAKSVTRDGSVALAAGDIKSGEVVVVVYDGTRFQVVSQLNSSGDARFANVSIASTLYVGGVATFTSGTAAAPAITTAGDTNTGIFFPAADTIAFAEGGVESARFDSSGRLGIGVTSPSYPLHVRVDAIGADTWIGSQNATATNTVGAGFIAVAGSSTHYSTFKQRANGDAELIQGNATGSLLFGTNNTERMRLDSSGNLGLGVTPSAWGSGSAIQLADTQSYSRYGMARNAYYDGAAYRYITSAPAALYQQSSNEHIWYQAGTGTAGNTISFTQAMTLTAAGDLALGATATSGNSERLYVTNAQNNVAIFKGTGGGLAQLIIWNDANKGVGMGAYASTYGGGSNFSVGANGAYVAAGNGAPFAVGTTDVQPLLLGTNNAERARVLSDGSLCVGQTTVPTNGASGSGTGSFSGVINCDGLRSHSGSGGAYQANNINFQWNGSAVRLWVDTTDLGSISVSSDYRVKKNIITQTQNALDRINKLRPVVYELADYGDLYKADGVVREGFIAHEVQEVIPSGAEGEKDEENRIQNLRLDAILSVAVKAIQEQQAMIKALEAKVAALEAK